MARRVLIAPVGYYESRLAKSILKSAADKVYLIKAKGPKVLEEYTANIVDGFKEKFGKMLIINNEESADFLDATEVYKLYCKIIEAEKLIDSDTEFVIDVTSTTKEGFIAATLVAQLYDIKISYTLPQEKLNWLNSLEMDRFLAETEVERLDPGGKYLQYNLKALPLRGEEIMILEEMAQKEYDSIRSLVNALGKKAQRVTPGATKKYWGHVIHELQDIGLVELSGERYKRPVLTEKGQKLIEGIKEAREKQQGKRKRQF